MLHVNHLIDISTFSKSSANSHSVRNLIISFVQLTSSYRNNSLVQHVQPPSNLLESVNCCFNLSYFFTPVNTKSSKWFLLRQRLLLKHFKRFVNPFLGHYGLNSLGNRHCCGHYKVKFSLRAAVLFMSINLVTKL